MLDTQKIKNEVMQLLEDIRLWKARDDQFFQNGKHMNLTVFTANMKTKYDYLYTNSSTLFDRCISGGINLNQLDYMLNMIDKVNNGADYNTASIAIGQQLFDVYVSPQIDKNKK